MYTHIKRRKQHTHIQDQSMKQIEPQPNCRIGTVSNIHVELLGGVCGLKPVLRDLMVSRDETSLLTKDVCQVHIVGRYIAA